jgi:hypothetical protein
LDWGELTAVCEDAFRAVATKKLVAELGRAHADPVRQPITCLNRTAPASEMCR